MKDFKKDSNKNFICEECGKTYKLIGSLSRHINYHKITPKQYFDKWLKEDKEGICDICAKETKFKNFSRFYQKTCSKKCNNILLSKNMSSKDRQEKIKQGNLKKYGVEYPMQSKIILKQINDASIKKYGVKNPFQSKIIKEKCKQTKLERYGDEKYKNWKKHKKTCLERFGTEYALSNKEIREKGKKTMKLRYGVEHQSQNENIHKKQMLTGKKIKLYKNTNLWYQGSFELDFLEKYYYKFNIERAHSIKYEFENKMHYYHPDFYISSLNLIIEIKNSYYAKRDKQKISAKKDATNQAGFGYLMIVDKNYVEFETKEA